MKQKSEILAVIPARGGSKGIPYKNIQPLAGKPLVSYTIEAAVGSKEINRVVLSTEDERIVEVARRIGVEIFNRSPELAKDHVHASLVAIDCTQQLIAKENYHPTHVLLLLPTAPLRTSQHIDAAIQKYKANESYYRSLISVVSLEKSVYDLRRIRKDILKPFTPIKNYYLQRQDVENLYAVNGSLYLTRTDLLLRYKRFHIQPTCPYAMDRITSTDIDEWADFQKAELFIGLREQTLEKIQIDPRLYFNDDPELGIRRTQAPEETFTRHMARYQKAIRLASRSGGLWLDCACGTGYGSALMSECADHVMGIDIDGSTLVYAQKHYGHPKIEFIQDDLFQLATVKDKRFDVIFSIETIEHVADCRPFLKLCYMLLKPNGVCVATTPISKTGGGLNPLNPHHLNELTREQFQEMTSSIFDRCAYEREIVVATTGEEVEQMYGICYKDSHKK